MPMPYRRTHPFIIKLKWVKLVIFFFSKMMNSPYICNYSVLWWCFWGQISCLSFCTNFMSCWRPVGVRLNEYGIRGLLLRFAAAEEGGGGGGGCIKVFSSLYLIYWPGASRLFVEWCHASTTKPQHYTRQMASRWMRQIVLHHGFVSQHTLKDCL